MTEEPYDYVAISDKGVVALCSASWRGASQWVRAMQGQGLRIEYVPVEEAVRRHREYLATLPEFAGLIEASAVRQDAPAE